jgi:hypothetical protein
MVKEYPDEKQRFAVCMSQWKQRMAANAREAFQANGNPNHDAKGRFASGHGGGQSAGGISLESGVVDGWKMSKQGSLQKRVGGELHIIRKRGKMLEVVKATLKNGQEEHVGVFSDLGRAKKALG